MQICKRFLNYTNKLAINSDIDSCVKLKLITFTDDFFLSNKDTELGPGLQASSEIFLQLPSERLELRVAVALQCKIVSRENIHLVLVPWWWTHFSLLTV